MKLKHLMCVGFCLSLVFVYNNAFANNTEDSGQMHVQISNEAGVTCQLTSQILRHGKFDSAPPQSIMFSDSKSFDMQQIFSGPSVDLTYQCGSNQISFEVQQNASLIFGHTPNVTILSKNGLTLTADNQSSSTLWGSTGIANITIRPAV